MAVTIDEMIDNCMMSLFNFFFVRVPMFVLPYLLTIYANMCVLINKCIKQTRCMWVAILNSFDNVYIGFYEIQNNSNTVYLPIVMTNNNIYNVQTKWLYDIHKKVFTLCEIHHNSTTHHIPFIGASLELFEHNSSELIGDMSEWLMDQTIFAPNSAIPLQILATTWLYTNSESKLLLSYKNMRMRIVNEDGEEKLYDLETENEIKEEN
jgi:hypothetical protein